MRITRNPFLWGVGLWALAHVLVGGDTASILLFASVGSLGLVGAPLLDAKKAKQHPGRWRSFSAATSSVPFLAIAQGRQRFALGELGLWRLAAGVAAFALLLQCTKRDGSDPEYARPPTPSAQGRHRPKPPRVAAMSTLRSRGDDRRAA